MPLRSSSSTLLYRIARAGLLAMIAGSSSQCFEPNPHHCVNKRGDATCRDRGYEYCDACTNEHLGCTNEEPRLECSEKDAGSGDSESTSATDSSGSGS